MKLRIVGRIKVWLFGRKPTRCIADRYHQAVFIGGAHDGKAMIVPDLPTINVPLPLEQQDSAFEWKTEVYRKERLVTGDSTLVFYVISSMSTTAAIERLFGRYLIRPKER